ncbi:MAG: hydrogenase iron-sulfur subunit [Deltaproteobacteria bacterium]|jgi:quinone-modifying oxidoreductase subunit QmoB|nr:hydrogenase iron-sulfur subunit [Deltaproteobacteria bacterium]MCL5879507.1 hydrogenase iron-sulfur subunit [Deltaproteobacteria bacterium]MDA8305114.1 hydrogenase iron-sulfur subunit [Deltaproteobacteria bacterium]
MDNNVGVYICSGCDIGKSLNVERLVNTAKDSFKPMVCLSHEAFCGEEGINLIKKDIAEKSVNKVVIAACSMRAKQDVFNFDPLNVHTERVNLREHVIWVSPPNDNNTQLLAEDNIGMGIARAKKAEFPEPLVQELNKTILVIGGGVTGLNSALNAEKAGYSVVLVEKKSNLGGFPYSKYKKWEANPPFDKNILIKNGMDELISGVENSKNIKIYKNSKIKSISGAPGRFNVEIESEGESNKIDNINENIGAIIVATGWKPYDAKKLDYLGYGLTPDILTNVELEELYSDLYQDGKNENFTIKRKSNGENVKSVAFLQCAGSRDENHLPYCSTVCCMSSLKEAALFRKNNPDANVYIIYKDIRTPGEYENFYRKMQDDEGLFLMKGIISDVSFDKGSNIISLKVKDTLFGGDIDLDVDMLVLAAGMVPNSGDFEAGPEVKLGSDNDSAANANGASCAATTTAGLSVLPNKSGILNLTYRQGKEMPDLAYGFPDSNFICFPYESRRTGIYPAGSVRAPMDAVFSVDDAKGAALKAIQCMEQTSRGRAVHPRSNDMTYPFFDLPRCTQCKRCTEECPFGAIDEDEKGTPKPNPERCRRCGVCMGACPVRIISFKNYSPDIIGSMIKSLYIPEDPTDENYRILVFACENDAYPALDILGLNKINLSSNIRVVPVRCLGSINNVWYADALSKGIDGILLLGCKFGDDYQCHFVKGSELASYRMGNLKETLTRLVLEEERVRQIQLEFSDYMKLPEIVDDFVNKIKSLGPNPYKGF